jgi:hypothetical protein
MSCWLWHNWNDVDSAVAICNYYEDGDFLYKGKAYLLLKQCCKCGHQKGVKIYYDNSYKKIPACIIKHEIEINR